jgi:hypothetical protein
MIRFITRLAYAIDQGLERTLGRPYNVILGVGLIVEIVRRLIELPNRMGSMPHVAGEVVLVIMATLLLIHQIGALSHHVERVGRRKESPPTD